MEILVTDNAGIELPLLEGVQAVYFDESLPIPELLLGADAVVCWGSKTVLQSLVKMPNLKWVQSLSAGTDAYESAGLPKEILLTSGRGLHDRTVSEHATTLLLSLVREMPKYFKAQQDHVWDKTSSHPKPLQLPERVSSLIDARVLIWGFGSIGQRLAPILRSLGSSVRGVATTAGERAGFEVVAAKDVKSELPNTDILVMILPSTPETKAILSAELLALLPSRAIVCNVGRGSTVNQEDLIEALENGTIAGAALDVTETEPLPADSPLWDLPNCIVTPHIAGYRADGGSQLVGANLEAFIDGGKLRNLVRR